jgi:thiosulfate reductase cytochrome b subunit
METVKKKASLYPLAIRIWHWVNTLLFIALIITGIQLRAPNFSIFSQYGAATSLHGYVGVLFVLSFLFWLFYSIFTGTIKHYLPRWGDVKKIPEQVAFYSFFVFRGRPNPFAASEKEKFNVLQKISYGAVMFILVPAVIITGILFNNILSFSQVINAIGGLRILDVIHVTAGYLLALFLIIHMYMATLGKTVTSYLKSMITGE